jgi:tetratricopeptide (TPR) repeat protein
MWGFLCLFLTGCCFRESCEIEPAIVFCTPPHIVEDLPSAFPPLTEEELTHDWAKELLIADTFVRENDLYRAITGYKRALILLPNDQPYRQQQIEYDIILGYYLGEKYQDAVETFEKSSLSSISSRFLAFDNLLSIIYDSYVKVNNCAKAEKVFEFLQKCRPEISQRFAHADDVINARFSALENPEISPNENLTLLLENYHKEAKSVSKAKALNAILPGAGYYYIGQKNTAFTAFIVNSLFIAATYYFFDSGNWPAGIITTSLEMGWYLGGINGAGLGAKERNEHIYGILAKDYMISQRLFPVLSFQTTF